MSATLIHTGGSTSIRFVDETKTNNEWGLEIIKMISLVKFLKCLGGTGQSTLSDAQGSILDLNPWMTSQCQPDIDE